eukprot:1639880-Amphidinium_carterae.1
MSYKSADSFGPCTYLFAQVPVHPTKRMAYRSALNVSFNTLGVPLRMGWEAGQRFEKVQLHPLSPHTSGSPSLGHDNPCGGAHALLRVWTL